jgi:hypothetical protein
MIVQVRCGALPPVSQQKTISPGNPGVRLDVADLEADDGDRLNLAGLQVHARQAARAGAHVARPEGLRDLGARGQLRGSSLPVMPK